MLFILILMGLLIVVVFNGFIFCQKHLVVKDSYMSYSTTHFS